MVLSPWEVMVQASLLGDDDALRLLPDETQATLRRARDLYRDGSTPDADIAVLIATIHDRRPVRLH